MSKRFGVDALLPIGLILWTLSPMILLVMGGLFQTVPAPDKVTNEPVDSSNTLGSQAPALFMISLPSGFILLSFYWACRRGDQKRKRLRFAWLVCLPVGILFWAFLPILMALFAGAIEHFYPDHVSSDGQVYKPIILLGVNLSDFLSACAVIPWESLATVPTGGMAFLVWLVLTVVFWMRGAKKSSKSVDGT